MNVASNEHNEETQFRSQKQGFDYQLECLKIEIGLINDTFTRLETITHNTKNFAIVTWAGGITILASQPELRRFIIFTSVLPILFWLIDAWWMSRNRGAHIRLKKISAFINSDNLFKSFENQKLMDFSVLDVFGKQYRGTKEYEASTGFKRIFWYKEMVLLYGGLAILRVSKKVTSRML